MNELLMPTNARLSSNAPIKVEWSGVIAFMQCIPKYHKVFVIAHPQHLSIKE